MLNKRLNLSVKGPEEFQFRVNLGGSRDTKENLEQTSVPVFQLHSFNHSG